MQNSFLPRLMYSPAPTCATTCAGDLAEVEFDDCNPKVAFSEIRRIFVAKSIAVPFTDWTEASEWVARVDASTTTGDDYIRALTVIGDKPAAASVTKDISNGRKHVVGKDHTLNFLIDDVSDKNYEFMRALECGGKYKLWYETEGGYMYGGNDGILANLDLNDVLNRGREEIDSLIGVANWRAKFTPERTLSPLYDGGNNPIPLTFDTSLTYAAATTDTDAGVTGVVPLADADLSFDFNAISPRVGTDLIMIVKIAGVTKITVTYKSDYLNQYFKFTDTAAVEHIGTFVNGTIDF